MKEDITKKLDAIQLRLDKGESIEKIIDDTFRNTSTPDIIFAVSERQARIFDKIMKEEIDKLWKDKRFDNEVIPSEIEDGVIIHTPKLSNLIGKLSKTGAEEMHQQIKELRKEWDRDKENDTQLTLDFKEDSFAGMEENFKDLIKEMKEKVSPLVKNLHRKEKK